MKLLIDAGNTRIKWALVKENAWVRNGVVLVAQAGELSGVFAEERDINQVWASNVAGEKVAKYIRDVGAAKGARTHFVRGQRTQCGVRNGYDDPAQLGSDRWASLIAAWHQVRGKCLVVNCGTAVTIDALSEEGEFVGGLIVPGIELMQRSLTVAAEQLSERHVRQQAEYVRFPANTADAMYSGAIQAACGAIERQHALLGDNAPVVLSGGAAGAVGAHLNLPLRVEDNLVLQGLLLILQESEGS